MVDQDMQSHGVASVSYEGTDVYATCICGTVSLIHETEAEARAEIEEHANGSH